MTSLLQHFNTLKHILDSYFVVIVQCNYCYTLFLFIMAFLAYHKQIPIWVTNVLRLTGIPVTAIFVTMILSKHLLDYMEIPIMYPNLLYEWSMLTFLSPVVLVLIPQYYYRLSAASILGYLLACVPLYLFCMCCPVAPMGKKVPSLLVMLLVYYFVTGMLTLFKVDFIAGFKAYGRSRLDNSTRLSSFAKSLTDKQKSLLVLQIIVGLTYSLLNLSKFSPMTPTLQGRLMLCLVLLSVVAYSVLGCVFIDSGHTVKYHYNFVFQTYINLYQPSKLIWGQYKSGTLPGTNLSSFLIVLTLSLLHAPNTYCGWGPLGFCTGDNAINVAEPGSNVVEGEPVGEGKAASKAVKDGARVTYDGAKHHATDIGNLVLERAKGGVVNVICAGSVVVAVAIYEGMGFGSTGDTITQKQFTETVEQLANESVKAEMNAQLSNKLAEQCAELKIQLASTKSDVGALKQQVDLKDEEILRLTQEKEELNKTCSSLKETLQRTTSEVPTPRSPS